MPVTTGASELSEGGVAPWSDGVGSESWCFGRVGVGLERIKRGGWKKGGLGWKEWIRRKKGWGRKGSG